MNKNGGCKIKIDNKTYQYLFIYYLYFKATNDDDK